VHQDPYYGNAADMPVRARQYGGLDFVPKALTPDTAVPFGPCYAIEVR
jgi:hypothetical protein